jgi:hypothetical protein
MGCRQEVLKALAELAEYYPEWRFGQMIANVAVWAKGPTVQAIWDMEDDELLAAVKKHLANKRANDSASG